MVLPPSASSGMTISGQKLDCDGGELLVELEDAAVAGVGIDDQFGAPDSAVQVFGKNRRDHPVVVTVGDEGGLSELGQVVGCSTTPLLDCLELGAERLDLDRRVPIHRALLKPLDEGFGGGLAGRVAVEEE